MRPKRVSTEPEESDVPPAIERPLRLIEVPDDRDTNGEFEVEAAHSWPLLPDATYLTRYVRTEVTSLRMFRGATRAFVHFQIVEPGSWHGTRLYGAWPVKSCISGGKTRLTVSPRSDLHIMLCRVLGNRVRQDRISFAPLRGCVLRVKTRTVRKNFRQRLLPECLQYSVVDDILSIEAGAI